MTRSAGWITALVLIAVLAGMLAGVLAGLLTLGNGDVRKAIARGLAVFGITTASIITIEAEIGLLR